MSCDVSPVGLLVLLRRVPHQTRCGEDIQLSAAVFPQSACIGMTQRIGLPRRNALFFDLRFPLVAEPLRDGRSQVAEILHSDLPQIEQLDPLRLHRNHLTLQWRCVLRVDRPDGVVVIDEGDVHQLVIA